MANWTRPRVDLLVEFPGPLPQPAIEYITASAKTTKRAIDVRDLVDIEVNPRRESAQVHEVG